MDIRDHLDPGEKLLWKGHPAQGLLLRERDITLIPGTLLTTGVMIAFIVITYALAHHDRQTDLLSWLPILFIVLFALGFLFYFNVGRFLTDALRRRRIAYALTDRRAIIVEDSEIMARTITDALEIEISGLNLGSIKFGSGYSFLSKFELARTYWSGAPHPFMFERVDGVGDLYRLVRDIQQHRGPAR